MDEYKESMYLYRPDFKVNVVYFLNRYNKILLQDIVGDIGDLTSRKDLRKKLNCKSFDWYIKHIFPEKFVPLSLDHIAFGQVENPFTRVCLDDLQQNRDEEFQVGTYDCQLTLGISQLFFLTRDGVLRVENSCLAVAKE